MVVSPDMLKRPFSLVVTGEAETWLPVLHRIVGPQVLAARRVRGDRELLDVVETGAADAAVLDDQVDWDLDVLQLLRQIRRMNTKLPVVVITGRPDRRWLETALQLAAFSVLARPLELEALLRQIHGMMVRMERMMRHGPHS